MFTRKFIASTEWVNDNAFCVRIEEYFLVKVKCCIFFKRNEWKLKEVHRYACWNNFIELMYKKHMLSGKTLWEIDTKI